jgi:hypothetical protein
MRQSWPGSMAYRLSLHCPGLWGAFTPGREWWWMAHLRPGPCIAGVALKKLASCEGKPTS